MNVNMSVISNKNKLPNMMVIKKHFWKDLWKLCGKVKFRIIKKVFLLLFGFEFENLLFEMIQKCEKRL